MEAKLDNPCFSNIIKTPLGEMISSYSDTHLISLHFLDALPVDLNNTSKFVQQNNENELSKELSAQLSAYFLGTLRTFSLPLEEKGTLFQNQVWNELKKIPFGETISYRALAERLGDVKKIRAAASANGKNPFMLVIPCHRVLGIDGKMIGYAGGIDRKRKLIIHEQCNIVQKGLLF